MVVACDAGAPMAMRASAATAMLSFFISLLSSLGDCWGCKRFLFFESDGDLHIEGAIITAGMVGSDIDRAGNLSTIEFADHW